MRGISKVILGLLICGSVLLLIAYGLYSRGLQAQDESSSRSIVEQTETTPARTTTKGQRESTTNDTERPPPQRQLNQPSADFYQPIVENNLFRPLGWRKPDDEPEFTLIGTLIESNNQRAKAFLKERRSNQYYPVSVGEKVGDAVVESIKPNEVSLGKDGKMVTLRADSNRFLDTSAISNKGGARSNQPSEYTSPEKEAQEENPESRGDRGWDENRMRKMAERFRNASSEERKRMKEEFRRRGRGERARREGRGRDRDGDRDTKRQKD